MRKPVLVSACLAGIKCRYDGGTCPDKDIQEMVRRGTALPVCPEQLAVLPTPRDCCELIVDDAGNRKIIDKQGRDHSKAFAKGAERTLALCKEKGIEEAVLKSKSPSCGSNEVYDGSFSGRLAKGDGVTAALLKRHGIRVRTEQE